MGLGEGFDVQLPGPRGCPFVYHTIGKVEDMNIFFFGPIFSNWCANSQNGGMNWSSNYQNGRPRVSKKNQAKNKNKRKEKKTIIGNHKILNTVLDSKNLIMMELSDPYELYVGNDYDDIPNTPLDDRHKPQTPVILVMQIYDKENHNIETITRRNIKEREIEKYHDKNNVYRIEVLRIEDLEESSETVNLLHYLKSGLETGLLEGEFDPLGARRLSEFSLRIRPKLSKSLWINVGAGLTGSDFQKLTIQNISRFILCNSDLLNFGKLSASCREGPKFSKKRSCFLLFFLLPSTHNCRGFHSLSSPHKTIEDVANSVAALSSGARIPHRKPLPAAKTWKTGSHEKQAEFKSKEIYYEAQIWTYLREYLLGIV
ncbi:hypothetical protein VP01_282g1 [Puccinia sorghi]|uniref:Uncharacterized protein n=1 Tax=Puccinia sorghi TaxID=27349 RepID=A0A0L6V312_9BASI|nr:hypothetical protein VP01_282g1 [Puccinia sorghi]